MNKYLIINLLCILIGFTSCSEKEYSDHAITGVKFTDDFIDSRDGKTYTCIEIGDQIWMAENLAYRLSDRENNLDCRTWQETIVNEVADSIKVEASILKDPVNQAFEEGKIPNPPAPIYVGTPYEDMYTTQYIIVDMCIDFMNLNVQEIIDMLPQYGYEGEILTEISEGLKKINREQAFKVIADKLNKNFEEAEIKNDHYTKTYGLLYSLEGALAAVPSEGDWRLPTDEDWKKLERFLGMSEGEVLKDNDWRGTNQAEYLKADKNGIGFNALYGGGKIYTPQYNKMEDDQTFINKGRNAYFWSSENLAETDSTRVGIMRSIATWTNQILRSTTRFENEDGHPTMYNVRLVKDKK